MISEKFAAAGRMWSKTPNAVAALFILRLAEAAHKLRASNRYETGLACGKHLTERAIDRVREEGDDERMSELAQTSQRRSLRIFHKMRLQAMGRSHEGRKFREICETQVVSAHGGLLMLKHEVNNGEMLVLVHPETQEEQECRIVYLGESGSRGIRVGVEFLTPAPHFWGIDFERGSLAGQRNTETSD
jgi:hypothetical protein